LINQDFFKDLDQYYTKTLLTNFRKLNESIISSDYGSKYLKIYRIINELIASAQIQRVIFLNLLSKGSFEHSKFDFSGIRESLSEIIINDLNDLFTCLNALTSTDETRLEFLTFAKSNSEVSISYNSESNKTYSISSFIEPTQTYFNKI